MTMKLLLSTLLLALVLPLAATADDGAAPAATAAVMAPQAPADAQGCAPEAPSFVENALEAAEPAYKSCTYHCTMEFECPDIIDTPPGSCVNGCCVYESSCQTTCTFHSDCGPQASCWSGCCYFWNH